MNVEEYEVLLDLKEQNKSKEIIPYPYRKYEESSMEINMDDKYFLAGHREECRDVRIVQDLPYFQKELIFKDLNDFLKTKTNLTNNNIGKIIGNFLVIYFYRWYPNLRIYNIQSHRVICLEEKYNLLVNHILFGQYSL